MWGICDRFGVNWLKAAPMAHLGAQKLKITKNFWLLGGLHPQLPTISLLTPPTCFSFLAPLPSICFLFSLLLVPFLLPLPLSSFPIYTPTFSLFPTPIFFTKFSQILDKTSEIR